MCTFFLVQHNIPIKSLFTQALIYVLWLLTDLGMIVLNSKNNFYLIDNDKKE